MTAQIKTENRGRKKLTDKKKLLGIYILESQIEALGGYQQAQEAATKAVLEILQGKVANLPLNDA